MVLYNYAHGLIVGISQGWAICPLETTPIIIIKSVTIISYNMEYAVFMAGGGHIFVALTCFTVLSIRYSKEAIKI